MSEIKLSIRNLNKTNAEQFERVVSGFPDVSRVNTWPGKAEFALRDASIIPEIKKALLAAGFAIDEGVGAQNISKIRIEGMTCRSCEITVERKFRKLPGVRKVDVDAGRGIARMVCDDCAPDIEALRVSLEGEKYKVVDYYKPRDRRANGENTEKDERPTFARIVGLFVTVFAAGWILSKAGLGASNVSVGKNIGFLGVIFLGLVAGSSSCLAVSGGLLLSSAAKFRERYGGKSGYERMRPVIYFVLGRVASYGILGGAIGLLGKSLTPSPIVTGAITVLAAFYMMIMGLEMLKIAPSWLKGMLPRMPKSLSHKVMDSEEHEHWAAPAILGAATFFLPCGFTQSLQLYALTTGSFATSGILLAGFALGTAPALIALGWASGSVKGKLGKWFFQFSGAVVIVLGLVNMQNGLTVAGYPITFPKFSSGAVAEGSKDSNVTDVGGKQLIRMKLINSYPYYSPSGTYTVRAGIPVKIEIDGYGSGCRGAFILPQLGVNMFLDKAVNEVEFTPKNPGVYSFSCSMGMYRGTLNVIQD